MARSAEETACILSSLYEDQFNHVSSEPFLVTWPQLRFISGGAFLTDRYFKSVNKTLSETDQCLIPFNHFLVIVMDQDLKHFRMLPDRLLEKTLYEIEDMELGDYEASDKDETDNAGENDKDSEA